jgi:hypothetical protein
VTQLEFVDWPRMIGIDNLRILDTPGTLETVPEPASLTLLGCGLAGLWTVRRLKLRRRGG